MLRHVNSTSTVASERSQYSKIGSFLTENTMMYAFISEYLKNNCKKMAKHFADMEKVATFAPAIERDC